VRASAKAPSKNVTFRNLLCCTNRSALAVGSAKRAAAIRNVTFDGVDILYCGRAMDIRCPDGAAIANVTFRDITIEEWFARDREHDLMRFDAPAGGLSGVTVQDVHARRPMRSTWRGVGNLTVRDLTIASKPIGDAGQGDIEITGPARGITFERER
jgi:hypothetical protein